MQTVYTGPQLVEGIRLSSLVMAVLSFSHKVTSDSLQPHGLQHARPPCPSPTPGVYSNSCPLTWWCHPTISASVAPFSSCLQSFPESGSFPMSQFFTSGGQNSGASAAASVLPMNTQGWAPLGLTGDWGDAPSHPCTRTPRDCSLRAELLWDWQVIEGTHLLTPAQGRPVISLQHHWALLCPIYFYAILSLVKNGCVLPFPPFPNWKRKGTNKPEFNLFWQLSQSSCSEGGPAHRRGMTLSHPGSKQRRPCFSPSVFSHVETYWPRCLPIHILMGKRERRTRFFLFFFKREWKIIKWHQTTERELG